MRSAIVFGLFGLALAQQADEPGVFRFKLSKQSNEEFVRSKMLVSGGEAAADAVNAAQAPRGPHPPAPGKAFVCVCVSLLCEFSCVHEAQVSWA
jgi:hypothetical protein